MSDLEQRMRELDHLQPPELWASIEARSSRPRTFMRRILDWFRLFSAMQVAAIGLALAAIIGAVVVVTNAGLQEIKTADQPGQNENKKGDDDQTGGGQTTEGDPAGSDSRPSPRAFPGSEGSTKDSQSGETPPAGVNSGGTETAGPPVFHTDQADDAYGQDAPPNAALSQPAFDILRVDWGPASYVSEGRRWGYSISIDLKGSARADGSYTSAGLFPSNDPRPEEGCQLFHSLVPGTTAFASAMCGSNETRREVGRLRGSAVTVTPTAGGGTRISATFDDRDVPPELEAADRRLQDLYTWTCMQRGGGTDCSYYVHVDILDVALSKVSYRI
jgi:hypothetical protein